VVESVTSKLLPNAKRKLSISLFIPVELLTALSVASIDFEAPSDRAANAAQIIAIRFQIHP